MLIDGPMRVPISRVELHAPGSAAPALTSSPCTPSFVLRVHSSHDAVPFTHYVTLWQWRRRARGGGSVPKSLAMRTGGRGYKSLVQKGRRERVWLWQRAEGHAGQPKKSRGERIAPLGLAGAGAVGSEAACAGWLGERAAPVETQGPPGALEERSAGGGSPPRPLGTLKTCMRPSAGAAAPHPAAPAGWATPARRLQRGECGAMWRGAGTSACSRAGARLCTWVWARWWSRQAEPPRRTASLSAHLRPHTASPRARSRRRARRPARRAAPAGPCRAFAGWCPAP